jgi:WD40 repeat protein
LSLAVSRRGHRLLVGNWGVLEEGKAPMVRLYDPADGRLVREVPVVGSCSTVVFSPDDRVAAIGTNMGRVFLLSLEDGDAAPEVLVGEGRPGDVATFITEPRSVHGAIGGLVFSPDGRRLTSASMWDEEHAPNERLGDLSVWDLEARREVRERSLVGRAVSMSDVDATPDGQVLLVACEDEPAELWLRSEEE